MSIPTRLSQLNEVTNRPNWGSSNGDLADGAWDRHMAAKRAERIAKERQLAERRHREPPAALTGKNDLEAMYTPPPPAAPAPYVETAQELVDRAAAGIKVMKAQLAEIAKSLGRTG